MKKLMEPYGKAPMDFFNKDESEDIIIHSGDYLAQLVH